MFKFLADLKELTWSHVAILFLTSVIILGSLYVYRAISSLDFLIEETIKSSKELFLEEFGLTSLQNDLIIREIIVETRVETGSSQVSIWGYHNTVKIGPFPFRKMSLLDESVERGSQRLALRYQDVPLNLYIKWSDRVWNTEGPFVVVKSEHLRTDLEEVYYFLEENNFKYMFAAPIQINDEETTIGMFTAFMDPDSYKRNRDRLDEIESIFIDAAGRIQVIFDTQYTRVLLETEKNE